MTRKQEKTELRRQARAARDRLTEEYRRLASRQICDVILSSDLYREAKTLRLFAAIGSEADLSAVALQALAEGKKVSYPCISGGELIFRRVSDLSDLKPAGKYQIPEPSPDLPAEDDSSALVLVPGLLFDRRGFRIGYGGGYYDRYLSARRERGLFTAGVCFSSQFTEEPLPCETEDIPVEALFLPGQYLRCL